jgi:UDP-N-acetylmuramate--alanine ligase
LAAAAGASPKGICQGLESFVGLRRRLEILGIVDGLMFIDDYAHHPTEIAATLATVRQMRPGGKICCVFEPHQASRTKSLLDELAMSLQNTDTLAVAEIFRAREPDWQPGEITAADLALRIEKYGKQVAPIHHVDEIAAWIVKQWHEGNLAEGDTVVTLGAGRIGTLAHGVYNRIRKDCSSE